VCVAPKTGAFAPGETALTPSTDIFSSQEGNGCAFGPIRLLVVDDSATIRAGLMQLVARAPDIELVGAGADGVEAVALAGEHRPDVVLMDLSMPRMDGFEATRRIVAAQVDARVVVLTALSSRSAYCDAKAAGAVGFVLKDAAPDEVLGAVRAAARGDSGSRPA
jgi:DNA-binding NarL/FixJ family response regulator